MEFTATFHKSQTDREGESKIIFTVSQQDLETIMRITQKYAGAQETFKVTVSE